VWKERSAIALTDRRRRSIAIALSILSAVVTLPGLLALVAFDDAPGVALAAPGEWPRGSGLERHADRAELLVFVHPFCTCTDATIAELARLETSQPTESGVPAVTFVAFRPRGYAASEQSSLAQRVNAVTGARLVWDEHGLEAARFGANTSGDVLLYGSGGGLLFHGGITGSRGHEGDNYGLTALRTAVARSGRAISGGAGYEGVGSGVSPVFGCSLDGDGAPEVPGTDGTIRRQTGGGGALRQVAEGLIAAIRVKIG